MPKPGYRSKRYDPDPGLAFSNELEPGPNHRTHDPPKENPGSENAELREGPRVLLQASRAVDVGRNLVRAPTPFAERFPRSGEKSSPPCTTGPPHPSEIFRSRGSRALINHPETGGHALPSVRQLAHAPTHSPPYPMFYRPPRAKAETTVADIPPFFHKQRNALKCIELIKLIN